jgi:hypothetical protein
VSLPVHLARLRFGGQLISMPTYLLHPRRARISSSSGSNERKAVWCFCQMNVAARFIQSWGRTNDLGSCHRDLSHR